MTLAVVLTACCWSVAGAAAPPNIVLILADDLGYGDVGCYGCPDTRTPAIDRLAEAGVRLTGFYANGPECSPTRTALFTGRYQQRAGGLECAIGTGNVGRYDDAIRLRETHDLGLPPEQNVLVRSLKARGYTTACFGKWHLGYEPKFFPLKHGFDRAFGPLGGGVDYFHHTESDGTPVLYLDDRPITRQGYLTDLITRQAVSFLDRHEKGPFFLYVPYTAPHTPYQGPDDRDDKPVSEAAWNDGTRATYVKMVERMDEGIAAILAALHEKQLDRDTVVIFASDNGPTRIGRAGPFSGLKSSLYEGGIRVPCIIRWPGALPGGAVADHVTMMMDLTASFVRIAGAQAPAERPLDGIDIIRELQAGRPPARRTIFFRARRLERTWRAVHDGDLKYLSCQDGGDVEEHLFDLAQDPGEKTCLLNRQPDDVQRRKRLLSDWEMDVRPVR